MPTLANKLLGKPLVLFLMGFLLIAAVAAYSVVSIQRYSTLLDQSGQVDDRLVELTRLHDGQLTVNQLRSQVAGIVEAEPASKPATPSRSSCLASC
jgi:hypothetical protein